MKNYYSKDKWLGAVADRGYELSPWGNGSCNAIDRLDGTTMGTWHARIDCDTGRANGWMSIR